MNKKAEIQQMQAESSDLVLQAKKLTIKSDPQFKRAAEFLLGVKALATRIIDHHEPMRKATYAAYQEVLAAKKKLLEPVSQAEGIVKGSMSTFMAQRQEKQDRIAERIKEGGKGRVREAPKVLGVQTRSEWTYEIVDEAKINRDFLTPSHSDIREVVKALGEDAVDAVGGIRVFKSTSIAASRGA